MNSNSTAKDICFALAFCLTAGGTVLASQTELTDEMEMGPLPDAVLVARAESALHRFYFQYDRSRDVLVERTNQMARVVFPRYFGNQSPTNGPDHEAVVWLDTETKFPLGGRHGSKLIERRHSDTSQERLAMNTLCQLSPASFG